MFLLLVAVVVATAAVIVDTVSIVAQDDFLQGYLVLLVLLTPLVNANTASM